MVVSTQWLVTEIVSRLARSAKVSCGCFNDILVEVAGIEPASFGFQPELLRAQLDIYIQLTSKYQQPTGRPAGRSFIHKVPATLCTIPISRRPPATLRARTTGDGLLISSSQCHFSVGVYILCPDSLTWIREPRLASSVQSPKSMPITPVILFEFGLAVINFQGSLLTITNYTPIPIIFFINSCYRYWRPVSTHWIRCSVP